MVRPRSAQRTPHCFKWRSHAPIPQRTPYYPIGPRLIPARSQVEGHGTHRVAAQHRAALKGKAFEASSPNGRFVEGAAAIDGLTLTGVEAIGKNLLYLFGAGASTVVMHVHFGMAGRFSTHALPGPAVTPTTRLKLVHHASKTVALLSAMTVQHGSLALLQAKKAELGPDPLREDADPERLWAKMRSSKRPVGLILMDQACVAGIGNIFRAEILFKAGVHPETPGECVSATQFRHIWCHSVDLLQRGFSTGSILTVDAEEGLPAPWLRRYVYNQSACGRCRGPVRTWDMATRTVYACETCQPRQGTMSQARAQAHAAAVTAVLFQSHCAPDSAETMLPSKMSVAQLKQALAKRGVSPLSGSKAVLLARLEAAWSAQGQSEQVPAVPGVPEALAALPAAAASPRAPLAPPVARPGTLHLSFASAEEAALEKVVAGESAAVEHVALADDASAALRKKRKEDAAPPGGVLTFRKQRALR